MSQNTLLCSLSTRLLHAAPRPTWDGLGGWPRRRDLLNSLRHQRSWSCTQRSARTNPLPRAWCRMPCTSYDQDKGGPLPAILRPPAVRGDASSQLASLCRVIPGDPRESPCPCQPVTPPRGQCRSPRWSLAWEAAGQVSVCKTRSSLGSPPPARVPTACRCPAAAPCSRGIMSCQTAWFSSPFLSGCGPRQFKNITSK